MNNKRAIELLAPAKNLEIGRAAIDCGADAVYIGAPHFGARQAAGNSIEDIAALVEYAHKFHCRVLVTLNTLLTDEELEQAVGMAYKLYEVGVDALIIQDMRLLSYDLPPIRLHASTQCDNRTAEQVKWLSGAGFRRAVLARELGYEEIRQIHEAVPEIELEAFVHGALCVSYSGRCYMSEVICGRSANRGACAQMCRYKYDILNDNKQIIKKDVYALSLRDLDRSQYLAEMLEAGVTTLKIEGRLKDIDYVRNVVAYYRQKLDAVFSQDERYCAASLGRVDFDFTPNQEKTFHRSHTDYFWHSRTAPMANFLTPKSTGEYIGKMSIIGGICTIDTDKQLHNGDGLSFLQNGCYVNGVEQISKGRYRVWLSQRVDDTDWDTEVYRNFDSAFDQQLRHTRTIRKIPIKMCLKITDYGFCLSCTVSGVAEVNKTFPCEIEKAQNQDKARQNLLLQLSKSGDTIFTVSEVLLPDRDLPFIPNSVLSSARRETLSALEHTLQQTITNEEIPIRHIVDIPELPQNPPLMTTKYCLLNEMGLCRKQNHDASPAQIPAYLKANNRLFKIKVDCKQCQMTITEA